MLFLRAIQIALLTVSVAFGTDLNSRTDESPLRGLPDEAELAWNVLRYPKVFAFGGIGVAGATSDGELAMRILLRYPNRVAIFKRAAISSSAEGFTYVLVVLHALDPSTYNETRMKLPRVREVETQEGCRGAKIALADVILQIDAGKYDRIVKDALK